jgi:putative ABC transport system permease protein
MTSVNPSLLPRLDSVPLAWRNLIADKRRLLRSSAGITFAVLLMMVQLGFKQGFFNASLSAVRALDGDLFVISASKYRFGTRDPFDHNVLEEVRATPGVVSAAPFYASWMDFFWSSPIDDKPYLVRVLAFDPDGPPVLSLPAVVEQQGSLKADDAVLVDSGARPFLGMDRNVAQTDLNGQRVQIAGRFGLGPDFMSDGTVVMSDRLFARLLPGYRGGMAELPIEAIAVKVRSSDAVSDIKNALQTNLSEKLAVMTYAEIVGFEEKFQADLSSAAPIFWLGTIVGFVVGMLISYQIIYNDVSDQLPQYATLKAMGYPTSRLVRSVLMQATYSAIAGYLPAWILCIVTYHVIQSLALLPLKMTPGLTLITLGLTLAMCLVAAALAVRPVISADPAEIF